MLTIRYEEQGQTFSDFQIRTLWKNPSLVLKLLQGKEELSVSSGLFIRLIQVLIAQGTFSHQTVTLEMEGRLYTFTSQGQIQGDFPKKNFASLAYEMSIEMLHLMSN